MKLIRCLRLTLVLSILALAFSGCGYSDQSVTFSQLISQAGGIQEVTENLFYGPHSIWGNKLVGIELQKQDSKPGDYHGPFYKIIVYNLATLQKQEIEPPEGCTVQDPAIYENKIVFAAVDSEEYFRKMISSQLGPPPNYDVFLFDLKSNKMQQLTTEGHAQMNPCIYGNTVVWLDARNQQQDKYSSSFDVYALDLKTMKEKRITADTTVEGYSQLALSENLVVWTDMRHADVNTIYHGSNEPNTNNEIYLYNLSTGRETRITDSPINDWSPEIDGKRIIWLRQYDYQKADVFLYDMGSGQEKQISSSGYAVSQISIHGDRIAWSDARSSQGNTNNDVIMNGQVPGADIYSYNLKSQTETNYTASLDSGKAWKLWMFPVIHDDYLVFSLNRQIGIQVFALNLGGK